MIIEPFNDHDCLGAITSIVATMATDRDPRLAEIAAAHGSTESLASWIRTLPQRDDEGETNDGPKVRACRPTQRLRIPASDPNCVERAALYVGAAELIDPSPTRRLRTEWTPIGLHTFPLENGAPITLDPRVTRNSLHGAAYVCDEASATGDGERGPIRVPMRDAVEWLTSLAYERMSEIEGGAAMVERARGAMHAAAEGARLPMTAIHEIALTLALAEREARAFGPAGVTMAQRAAELLDRRLTTGAQRNLRIGGYTIRPDWQRIAKVGQAAGRLGERAGWLALRASFARLGVGGPMLDEIEREMNRSGLTLGRLATEPEPMPGTLAAYVARYAARR